MHTDKRMERKTSSDQHNWFSVGGIRGQNSLNGSLKDRRAFVATGFTPGSMGLELRNCSDRPSTSSTSSREPSSGQSRDERSTSRSRRITPAQDPLAPMKTVCSGVLLIKSPINAAGGDFSPIAVDSPSSIFRSVSVPLNRERPFSLASYFTKAENQRGRISCLPGHRPRGGSSPPHRPKGWRDRR